MHKALVSNNLPTINQICTNDITEVENWLETIKNKDIVIKPLKVFGTDGVTRVKMEMTGKESLMTFLEK